MQATTTPIRFRGDLTDKISERAALHRILLSRSTLPDTERHGTDTDAAAAYEELFSEDIVEFLGIRDLVLDSIKKQNRRARTFGNE